MRALIGYSPFILIGAAFLALMTMLLPSNVIFRPVPVDFASLILLYVIVTVALFSVFEFLYYLYLKNIWIEIREDGLFIQRGIVAKKRSTLLYSGIQDVKERQSLMEKILGIKRIMIVTMTALSAAA